MRAWVVLVCGLAACNAPSDPKLSTTEQLSVVVGPAATNFGSVIINTTSSPATFTVSPAGSGETDQTITSIVGCNGFAIDAPGLPAQVFRHCGGLEEQQPTLPGEEMQAVVGAEQAQCPGTTVRTYTFSATFTPTAVGNASCIGQIVMNNGTQTFNMQGTGTLPPLVIDVRPTRINFGDIRNGDSSDVRAITLANAGANDLDVTYGLTIDDQIKLTKGSLATKSIPKGTADRLEFVCTPDGAAEYTGKFSIASNDPVNPKIDVDIACRGIDTELSITPTSLSTAPILVDQTITATVNLKNEGNTDGLIKSVELEPGTNPTVSFVTRPAANFNLVAKTSTPVTIQYAPDASLTGELGFVVVEFDDDEPRKIAINGEAKLAKVESDPPSVVFGPVCANVANVNHVDVYAGADGEFDVTAGTAMAPFGVQPLGATKTLGPPGSDRQRFIVSVTPAEPTVEDELVSGTLVVQSTAPNQTAFEIPMTAQPLPSGINATKELSLGAAELGDFTAAQTVKFTNCGDHAVMINDEPRFLGANASEFKLSKVFMPTMVGQAQTFELDVVFAPKVPGQRIATMEIAYDGGVAEVALVGDGLGELDGRDTYYACSTGGGAGWPIGLVVVVIARRRRRVR